MADYQDFVPAQRLGKSLSLSADGAKVAYGSDASGQFNLWIQPSDGGSARQLTFFSDKAVREVAWTPDGSAVAITADTCGDEQYQVYVVPADGGEPVLVSSGRGQHFLAEKTAFDRSGRYLLYCGNDREPASPDVIVSDLTAGTQLRFPGPADAYGFPLAVAPDGRHLLAGAIASNTKCQCYVASLDRSGTPLERVTADLPGEYYYPGPWTADGGGCYVLTTDADQDHVSLGILSLDERTLKIIDSPQWNVEDVVVSGDGRTVVWSVNEDGYSVLRARRDGVDVEVPDVPGGMIRAMSASADGDVLALLLDTPTRPSSVALVRLGSDEPIRYLTDTRPAVLQSRSAVVPQLVHYPSADGTEIPALLYRPSGPGPHPVLVSIHGGPEVQARPEYDPLHQCLLANGIAVLAPNIRGSSGYGHAWQTRIYRDWGGIDLTDLAAAHAWLADQPWADAEKVAVYGMSYGGFASLSCVTRLPELWAAGVSVCGPSNLDSLARAMPPDWAATVAAMFGDINDPSDAGELRRRSPLTYASQITAPLLVIQGATDPRVPKAEADQIVAAARANGSDVRYEVFDDEGHGFTSRENDLKAHTVIAEFLLGHLQ